MDYSELHKIADLIIKGLEIQKDEESTKEFLEILGNFATRQSGKLQKILADEKLRRN